MPVADAAQFEALAPEWAALWDRCPGATPFQGPWWLLPWWRHLFGGGRMLALTLRCPGRLTGLAPLFTFGLPGEPRRAVMIGTGITDYLDLLIEPEASAAGAAAVLEYLAARRAAWDVCDFQELREGSPLLAAPVPEGLRATRRACATCPVIELPASMQEVEARLERVMRQNYRRARHKLERLGARFEMADAGSLEEFLSALYELHEARWQARNDSGVLGSAALRAFYTEAASRMLARGLLRLCGLRLEGRLLAVLYGFAARGRFFAYLSGFDPVAAQLSPGTVLLGMAIEHAIAEGLREFDFLRQTEEFKRRWGAADRMSWQLLIDHG